MFSPGGLDSLNNPKDFEIMEELTYHQSLQSTPYNPEENLLYLTKLQKVYSHTTSQLGNPTSPSSSTQGAPPKQINMCLTW